MQMTLASRIRLCAAMTGLLRSRTLETCFGGVHWLHGGDAFGLDSPCGSCKRGCEIRTGLSPLQGS